MIDVYTKPAIAYFRDLDDAFHLDIDFAQLVKIYGNSEGTSTTERKYSQSARISLGYIFYLTYPNNNWNIIFYLSSKS
ncbi:MAG: hypothetical protein M3Z26_06800 [Bacteroidota bacterium]|nr:hypothetical protein [Bacteroidota bacterium]